jgi:subtilisin family serine protease/thiol-disulfide isomerase/thioredoxin
LLRRTSAALVLAAAGGSVGLILYQIAALSAVCALCLTHASLTLLAGVAAWQVWRSAGGLEAHWRGIPAPYQISLFAFTLAGVGLVVFVNGVGLVSLREEGRETEVDRIAQRLLERSFEPGFLAQASPCGSGIEPAHRRTLAELFPSVLAGHIGDFFGRPSVIVYFDPACPACVALARELDQLEKALPGKALFEHIPVRLFAESQFAVQALWVARRDKHEGEVRRLLLSSPQEDFATIAKLKVLLTKNGFPGEEWGRRIERGEGTEEMHSADVQAEKLGADHLPMLFVNGINVPNSPKNFRTPCLQQLVEKLLGLSTTSKADPVPADARGRRRYAVVLKRPPLLERFSDREVKAHFSRRPIPTAASGTELNPGVAPVDAEETQIWAEQDKVLQEIDQLQSASGAAVADRNNRQGRATAILNCLSVRLSASEAIQLQKNPLVRDVVLDDRRLQPQIANTVHLTGADKIWTLDQDGNDCTKSGKPCLNGSGVKIGFLDTGVDYTHGAFGSCTREQIIANTCPKVQGWNFQTNDRDAMDRDGHGTSVASIAAGNGGGMKGMAPGATVYAYRDDGEDYLEWEKMYLDGVNVISESLAAAHSDPTSAFGRLYEEAARNLPIPVVVCAANNGPSGPKSMSAQSARAAFTVGANVNSASDPAAVAPYSSQGWVSWVEDGQRKFYLKPDVVATGDLECVANPFQSVLWWGCPAARLSPVSGTSASTSVVSGALALVIQAHPDWTKDELRSSLMMTAVPIADETLGRQGLGSIRVDRAIALQSPPPIAYFDEVNQDGGTFIVTGIAEGRNFARYTIEVTPGMEPGKDARWSLVYEGTTPVNRHPLAEIPASQFPLGNNALRLKVYDSKGLVAVHYIAYARTADPGQATQRN